MEYSGDFYGNDYYSADYLGCWSSFPMQIVFFYVFFGLI